MLWTDQTLTVQNQYTQYPGVWGGLISQRRPGASYYYGFDLQGSVRVMPQQSGSINDRYTYKAFGEQVAQAGSNVNLYHFGGQWGYYQEQGTPENGVRYYVRARHLRVDLGRWVSRDPIWLEGGEGNPYSFADNSPTDDVQPIDLFAVLNAVRRTAGAQHSRAKASKARPFGHCPGLTKAEIAWLPKAPPPSEATNCKAFSSACLEYLFDCQTPARQKCFKMFGDWAKTLTDCACSGGANPLLLLALAWIENHWGTTGGHSATNQNIICHNPFSIHFNGNATGIRKLLLPNGCLPSFQQSACAAAQTVHRDGGVKKPAFGNPGDTNFEYEYFKALCRKAGKG